MSEISIDQQFIEYVVKSLVSNPDAVIIERIIDEKGVLLTLTVDPEDLGRVIGKRGATAQSLRTLLRALGTKQESRFNLKIVDNGIPREEREAQKESQDSSSYSSSYSTSTESRPPRRNNDDQQQQTESASSNDGGGWNSGSDDSSSAAQDAANDSGEPESAIERTRRELMDLDDLDV
jgi:predicted RNA-binding protein YlqC (UPF0109 family)